MEGLVLVQYVTFSTVFSKAKFTLFLILDTYYNYAGASAVIPPLFKYHCGEYLICVVLRLR